MDYSQITVVGRVQPRDAEVRYSQSGTQMLSFKLVVNRKRKQADGSWDDAADWFQVSAFGKLAEMMESRAVKGERLLVSGRFSSREWTDNDGRVHTALEITANDILVTSERPRQETEQQPEREVDVNELPF